MLKIRLRRGGATHAPFYRIVVSDSLKTPSAATVEQIGHYDPKKNPADVKIDRERVDYWVRKRAELSPTVKSLLKKLNYPVRELVEFLAKSLVDDPDAVRIHSYVREGTTVPDLEVAPDDLGKVIRCQG